MIRDLIQLTVDGVLMGGTYGLLAAGLALIFGVLKIVNFAQADFMMLAMYAAFLLWVDLGMDPLVSAPIVFGLFLVLGFVLHRTVIRRVVGAGENHDAQVVLTLGLGLVIQNGVLLVFSATPRILAVPYAHQGWTLGWLYIDEAKCLAFVVAVLVAVGSFLFLHRTTLGRAIRAVSDDWEAATYMGVNVGTTHGVAFGMGIALTAVGGVMLATLQPMDPFVGLDFVVIMFAAVVLGGLGSMYGALAGGVLIGVVHSVSQIWSSAALAEVWVFGLLLLVLYARPHGLFGRALRRI